jgi:hypothetical protein
VPSGFNCLCSDNLPDVSIKPEEHFNTVLWAGDDSAPRTITGVGFNPDLAWVKGRTAATDNHISDSIRGANNNLVTNSTGAEYNPATATSHGGIGAVTTDGFTLISGTADPDSVNESGQTYASWNWKAGGTAVSNTDGTITSSVSANTDAGFSIVTYSGNLTAGATVGHGLGVVPSMMIFHRLNTGGTDWIIYHSTLGATQNLAFDTSAAITSSTRFNNTAPSSSVFTLGTTVAVNGSADTYVAYCFHSVEGYSKVGSYVGNGVVDGTFIYTGFKPAFVMIKNTTTTGTNWTVIDTVRNEYNVAGKELYPNESDAEADYGRIDIVSNGFKNRIVGNYGNSSGDTYIYLAFAESPFKYSNAR